MNNKSYFTIFLILLILLLATMLRCSNLSKKYQSDISLYENINDSVVIYKNKYNENVSKIFLLKAENTKQFLRIQSDKEDILKLQELVKDYKKQLDNGGAIVYIKGETIFDTTIIKQTEFITINNKLYYEDSINNNWIYSRYGVNGDTTFFSLKTVNEYSVILGSNKKLFKKPEYFVEVINHNPYSVSSIVRSVDFNTIKNKKFGLGLSLGVGLTSDFNFRPYIGIGVNYNLIKF